MSRTFAGCTLEQLRRLTPAPGREQTVATIHALVTEVERLDAADQQLRGNVGGLAAQILQEIDQRANCSLLNISEHAKRIALAVNPGGAR